MPSVSKSFFALTLDTAIRWREPSRSSQRELSQHHKYKKYTWLNICKTMVESFSSWNTKIISILYCILRKLNTDLDQRIRSLFFALVMTSDTKPPTKIFILWHRMWCENSIFFVATSTPVYQNDAFSYNRLKLATLRCFLHQYSLCFDIGGIGTSCGWSDTSGDTSDCDGRTTIGSTSGFTRGG